MEILSDIVAPAVVDETPERTSIPDHVILMGFMMIIVVYTCSYTCIYAAIVKRDNDALYAMNAQLRETVAAQQEQINKLMHASNLGKAQSTPVERDVFMREIDQLVEPIGHFDSI